MNQIANWQRKAVMAPTDGELKEKGRTVTGDTGQENLSPSGLVVCLSPPPPPPSSSSSCCASADCYQPQTSPSIRVRARAKRSSCRQPIGRDGPSRRLLANGHPDAPDVTHSALSALRAREARGRSDSKTC